MAVSLAAALSLAALSLAAPAFASAQESTDERARAQFRLAQAHYANGSFLEAAQGFEQAYELSNRPELLYNIYVAYRDAGDLPRSRDALRLYLQRLPDADGAALLRARLETLGRMTEDGAATDPDAATDPSDAGDASSVAAGEESGVAGSTAEAAAVPEASVASPVTQRSEADASPSSALSPYPFVVAGAGAALVIAGVITGVMALDQQSSLDQMCVDGACAPEVDHVSRVSTGRTLATATDVLWIGGGVVLAAGVAWLLVEVTSSPLPAPPITAACTPEGCSVALRLDL